MKLKINLTRGGKGEAAAAAGGGAAEEERGESSNNNKKEKRNSKEKKKTKKDSLAKPPKEKKKDKKTEKDAAKAAAPTEDEATKLMSSSKRQLPLLRSSHSKNPVAPSEPEPTSPRGAAVSKWEQALRNEEKSKSPAADSAPSNHQRYATTTGAAPAAPVISPLDLSAEAGTSATRITPPPKALHKSIDGSTLQWMVHASMLMAA
jgi:hypothetical protein